MTLFSPILVYIRLYLRVSGVKVKDETWSSHEWLRQPRRLAIEPDRTVMHYHCVRCGRDFVSDPSSNSAYAVFVSAISFDQLEDAVTKRWLSEPCPGRHASSDDEDRSKVIAVLRVFDGADLSLPAVEVRTPHRSEFQPEEPRRKPVRRPKNRR
jgi:hypothetical protein